AVGLGLLGLAAGLVVYYTRGKQKTDPQPEPPAVAATPPAQLAGLGYLPAESNIVFAGQPGPILAYATPPKQDPRELLTRAGVPAQVFGALDQLGLTLQQIDHIAGGAFLPSGPEDFRLAFVLVLRQELANEDEFLKKLKAKPAPGKKDRYTIELDR